MNTSKTEKGRNSHFEVIRIVGMVLIILQHCCQHNTVNFETLYLEHFLPGLVLQWGMLGRLGVTLFGMIFGYFGIKQSFNTKRLINLIITVLTYSIFTYTIMVLIDPSWFSMDGFVKSLLPISKYKYWFISAYVIFYLFTPFLNKGLSSLSKEQFVGLITVMVALWSFAHTVTVRSFDYYCNELEQFILFYCIGAFMRLHCQNNTKIYKYFAGGGVLIYFIAPVIFDILGSRISILFRQANKFHTRTSIPTLMIAIGFIGIQMQKPYKNNAIINRIAENTFGIYLFHVSIVKFLFSKFEPITPYVDSVLSTLIYLLINVVALFISGLLVETVRKRIESAYQPLVTKLAMWLQKKWDRLLQIENKIVEKL